MSEEENPPAPNWLVKLEEQRAKRLKAKLGHEAGAGAPCQNCGEKCPGLDLHFWRKICKICKCGKEDHDISDDDYVCGFVHEALLGSRPSKAKNIFIRGKKDAVTLDWTPKGSNMDVKKYLDELPDDLLPVKGSEAAKLRKQRLQKQMPAHDIDASLCHALTPQEIEQLEEYVAHIRKYSVGQGKVIQLSMLKGQQHKFGHPNTQFLTQFTPGQLASSQPVHLQSSDVVNNLHNLSLHSGTDKQSANNRTNFLMSQFPKNVAALNKIDEQNPESVNYNADTVKMHPNYLPQSIHQIVDSQNPVSVGKTSDLVYPLHSFQYSNPISSTLSKSKENIQEPIISSQYLANNPEFAGKLQNIITKHPVDFYKKQNPESVEKNVYGSQNLSASQNAPFSGKTPEFAGKFEQPNANYNDSLSKFAQNDNPNLNAVHGVQNYVPNYENMPHSSEIMNKNTQLPYNPEKYSNVPTDQSINSQYYNANPAALQYSTNLKNPVDIPTIQQYPLTTTNVELHQEQFQDPEFLANLETNNAVAGNFIPSDVQHQHDFKNRVPLPVLNAKNVLNPLEYEQNISSVGYIRDIDYNRPPLQSSDPNDVVNSNLSCHKCKKPFNDGSIAVSVDRTKSLWHPGCFNCHTCEQPLADLLYLYHKDTDNIYCGRDYALLKGIPRCAACDELIFVREYCLAEDKTFHVKHFCCFECDEPLAGKQYVMENNQPVCVDCYEQLKAEKCNDCGYVIRPDQQGVSLQNLHWHAEHECFACKNCRKNLLGAKLLLRNQNLFCSDVCYKSYH